MSGVTHLVDGEKNGALHLLALGNADIFANPSRVVGEDGESGAIEGDACDIRQWGDDVLDEDNIIVVSEDDLVPALDQANGVRVPRAESEVRRVEVLSRV